MVDNALQVDQQIFSYEANDLTRGWELESCYVWPKDTRAAIGSSDGQYQACFSIATDTIDRAGLTFTDVCDAGDNRQCGWLQAGYQLRDSSVADFLANSGNSPNPAKFVLDPQTVVVSALYINCYSTSDSSTSPAREWNYMVVLKPRKMQPMQTILHIIKGKGQDVDN
jgi:hypothetical protein